MCLYTQAHLLPLQYEVSLLHHQAVKRALSSALAATQPLCVQLAGVCVAAISPLAVMEELDVSFASASQRLAATQTCTTGVSTWQVRRAPTHGLAQQDSLRCIVGC